MPQALLTKVRFDNISWWMLTFSDSHQLPLPYQLEVRPRTEYNYEGAKNKLLNLHILQVAQKSTFWVPGEPMDAEEPTISDVGMHCRQGRLLQVSAWLNMDNRTSMGCVGAVLTYLQRKCASEYLPGDQAALQAYPITSLETFTLQDTMLVSAHTLSALQIIQPESHPNTFNQGPTTSRAKEALSLYGLFNPLARTPQGKARLRRYFLRPSLDLDELNARLDFVSVFVRSDNLIALQKLNKSMSRIKNMKNTTTMLRKGISGGHKRFGGFKSGVWASILEFCFHALDMIDTLKEVVGGDHLQLRTRALEVLDRYHLQRIGKMVHETMDLELSTEQHRTVIKYGVNEDLDRVKEMYDGMNEMLSKVAQQIAADLPDENVELTVVYIPQLGFHINVAVDERTGQAICEAPDWQRMFTASGVVFFKNDDMKEMDNQLGDLYATVCDLEIEISYDLAQRVLQDDKMLEEASDICGELDSLLAFAQGAHQYKLTRPKLNEENTLDVVGGRHPLQEMTVPAFVANHTQLVGGNEDNGPNMIVVTGPNYSGKSVYLKQVALAVYMAHIGSFVAADSASIGLTDKILTRIATKETVSRQQSAFMIDLQQICHAINQCTKRSLVVIDEFGKGTDACDGAGLAAGVFEHFLSLGSDAPKVIAATHFPEIFDHTQMHLLDNLAFAHMEVLVDRKSEKKASDHASQVTYLYNLRAGRNDLAYGVQCAAMNGVPTEVVSRAAELAQIANGGGSLVHACACVSSDELVELDEAEALARQFLAANFETANDHLLEEVFDEPETPEGFP